MAGRSLGFFLLLAAVAFAVPPLAAPQAQQKKGAKAVAEKPRSYRLGDLTLSVIWSHKSAARNGAAFLTITNAGEDDDALIDASTPVAKRIELQGPADSGEAWETSRVDEIPAPAKQKTLLKGSALHLKLIGLRGPLKAGSEFPITLTFERAGAITVQARVLSPEDAARMIESGAKRKAGPRAKRRNKRRTRRPARTEGRRP